MLRKESARPPFALPVNEDSGSWTRQTFKCFKALPQPTSFEDLWALQANAIAQKNSGKSRAAEEYPEDQEAIAKKTCCLAGGAKNRNGC